MLLRDRSPELAAAGVRVVALSLDSHWSHRAWGEALRLRETVELVSDRLGEAASAFGVLGEQNGIPRAERSAFLLRGATVVESWLLGSDLPDVDAVLAAVSSS